jgi:hypothetical protein
MAIIANYPQTLLDEHHHWHDPTAHPGSPGTRENQPGSPGAGLEFLQFHRDYVRRFREWYDAQPGADPTAVEPWTAIPNAMKNPAVTGWDSTLAAQEQRIQGNNPPFASADALGDYIEFGIHGWLHNAAATVFNEPMLRNFHSPTSTYFYQLHGLVDRWWRQWVDGQTGGGGGGQMTTLTVGARAVSANIGQAGEMDLYTFAVTQSGSYTIETQGTTDVVMSLFGPNNLASFIAEDDDSGQGSNARIVRNLVPGNYFVRVRHYSATATGAYRISVRLGNTSLTELSVNGAAIAGSIAVAGESDLFSFNAAAAGLHTIETSGSTDTLIALYGPDDQSLFIAQDDDSGADTNSRIIANLQPGRYFVRVRHYSTTGTGDYSVRVSR